MMVNLDNSSSAVAIPTSVGLGLEDLLHVNNNNNEIPEKNTAELTTINPCNNKDQENKSSIIEKVGKPFVYMM